MTPEKMNLIRSIWPTAPDAPFNIDYLRPGITAAINYLRPFFVIDDEETEEHINNEYRSQYGNSYTEFGQCVAYVATHCNIRENPQRPMGLLAILEFFYGDVQ